jgi:hypothetical protein
VNLDLAPALAAAGSNLQNIVVQAAPFLFGILAAIAGIGLIMKMVQSITGNR